MKRSYSYSYFSDHGRFFTRLYLRLEFVLHLAAVATPFNHSVLTHQPRVKSSVQEKAKSTIPVIWIQMNTERRKQQQQRRQKQFLQRTALPTTISCLQVCASTGEDDTDGSDV